MNESANPILKYFSEFKILKTVSKDFWLTNVVQFFDGMAYFSMITVFVLYLTDYCSFNDADAALWVGLYTLFISAFVFAVGSICDIIGIRRTYLIGFIILTYFVINGTSHSVNLTDGLDGLAIMPTVMVSAALAIFAYVAGHMGFSKYLGVPYIPGAGELAVICGAIAGAGLGFLWFNAYPAEVFMGDVGALALGAAMGTIAVIVRQEIVLFIMGGLFVAEALSVMVQVLYFKYTGGKRIFRMAPLHHHYELGGWKETQVVVRFWIITIMLVLFGLSTLKLR